MTKKEKEINDRTNKLYFSLDTCEDKNSVYREIMMLNQDFVDSVVASVRNIMEKYQFFDIEDIKSEVNIQFLDMIPKYNVYSSRATSLAGFCYDALHHFAAWYIRDESYHGLRMSQYYLNQLDKLQRTLRAHGYNIDDTDYMTIADVTGLSCRTLWETFYYGSYEVDVFEPDDPVFDVPCIEHRFEMDPYSVNAKALCSSELEELILDEFEDERAHYDYASIVSGIARKSGVSRIEVKQAVERFFSKLRNAYRNDFASVDEPYCPLDDLMPFLEMDEMEVVLF